MAYRIKKARESPDQNYVNRLVTKLTNLGKSCSWKLLTTGSLDTTKFDGVLEDANVKKILAAIDMFLVNFDDHELTFLRSGTLISRYKQCMGLLDVFFADSAFYLPKGEILQWIFLEQVAAQIADIYEQPDEIGSLTSYMPYSIDLEIVGKFPYSATANDAVHNWTHILGCLSGLNRSKKAAVVGSPAPALVLAPATAAYGLGKSTVLKQTFLRGQEKEMVDLGLLTTAQAKTIDLLEQAPLDKTAKGWVAWSNSDSARAIISAHFEIQVKHFRRERARSMEAFLAENKHH